MPPAPRPPRRRSPPAAGKGTTPPAAPPPTPAPVPPAAAEVAPSLVAAKAPVAAKTPVPPPAKNSAPATGLAALPKVDKLAAHPSLSAVKLRLGTATLTQMARLAVEDARQRILAGAPSPSFDDLAADVAARAHASLAARARPVINATGVILHTNLGRAPLSEAAVEALVQSAGHYTSVEIDLSTGKRGARGAFAEEALARITGAEAALVVNNNAAAVMLALSALAFGKKVLVSRGELVEIGGGFRVPDVLARSGAVMVEVGTTNKTRLDDYARALDEGGVAVVLCVHQGNFRQVGFVERPEPGALVRLAHERGVLAVHDLGGGALIDFAPYGLRGETTVQDSIRAGFDAVCFSTDKALGGPQGGVIAGRTGAVGRARRDPLARALRLGRLPLVALEATLASYLEEDLDAIPTLAAIRTPVVAVRARAAAWQAFLAARGAHVELVDLAVAVGGGTLADDPLPSAGLALDVPDPDAVARRLRACDPPVFARIQDGKLLFDARTVLPGEDASLLDAILAVLR